MAREVAVDVASHSPQVDPILDELIDALADLEPTDAGDPVLLGDTVGSARPAVVRPPTTGPTTCATRCGSRAAVQAALEDGFRVFAELAPHPLLTHAVQQNASSLDMPIAALAAMRREQELPSGLRGFVADVFTARVPRSTSRSLYPDGRLVDAPLPTWTHRELMLSRESQDHPTHGTAVQAVHPLLGAHVHLFEEPERHVWQGEVGTAAHPWLGDHQIHGVAALPGAAYCEMALDRGACRARRCRRGPRRRASTRRCCSTTRPRCRRARRSSAPGVLDFAVDTHVDGDRVRRASADLHALEETHALAPAYDIAALLAEHPSPDSTAPNCARRSTASASSTAPPSRVWPRCTPPRATSPPCWPRSRCPV